MNIKQLMIEKPDGWIKFVDDYRVDSVKGPYKNNSYMLGMKIEDGSYLNAWIKPSEGKPEPNDLKGEVLTLKGVQLKFGEYNGKETKQLSIGPYGDWWLDTRAPDMEDISGEPKGRGVPIKKSSYTLEEITDLFDYFYEHFYKKHNDPIVAATLGEKAAASAMVKDLKVNVSPSFNDEDILY